VTPKARLIPLSQSFLSYLRADGIILPPDDDEPRPDWSDSDSGIFSSTENASEPEEDEDDDPSAEWRDVHQTIKDTIEELGGKVVPKLNWSAPKDATWINATNSMECRTPNDVYLLLKSSDFVTHDLEHAFDDCVDDPAGSDDLATTPKDHSGSTSIQDDANIPYHLVLRKYVQLNPSVEFRCFVRNRKLIAICQRDLNHFGFLFRMQDKLRHRIQTFFDEKLKDTFPDPSFAFDVYIPPPHDRVWLVDINPWAQRTDPLLFSWLELLTLPEPPEAPAPSEVIRLPLRPKAETTVVQDVTGNKAEETDQNADGTSSGDESDEAEEELFVPEFRLVRRDDPEAYGFTTPQYSAHKLPRDVVDASRGGEGQLREFAQQWKEVLARRQREDEDDSEDD